MCGGGGIPSFVGSTSQNKHIAVQDQVGVNCFSFVGSTSQTHCCPIPGWGVPGRGGGLDFFVC